MGDAAILEFLKIYQTCKIKVENVPDMNQLITQRLLASGEAPLIHFKLCLSSLTAVPGLI